MARSQSRPVDVEFERALAEHGRLEPSGPGADRPRVAVNMVVTVDGHTTVAGRVGDLTSPPDQMLLRHLRSQADLVLVGANTVRQEGYGTLRSDSGARADPTTEPATQQPWLCIVSEHLALSPDVPALQNPHMRVLFLTSSDKELPDTGAQVEYLRQPFGGPVSMQWALGALRQERGAKLVVSEGGPSLIAHLFRDDCVDDLFLAVSPRVLGDAASLTLLTGSLPAPVEVSLRSHLTAGDFMFLRYGVS